MPDPADDQRALIGNGGIRIGHASSPLQTGGGLSVENAACFLALRRAGIEIDLADQRIGPLGCGPRADRLEPALEMREILERLGLALVGHDPGIAGDVRDRIVLAR